jgi:hypothetical protein
MRPKCITCPRCGNQKKVGPRGPVPRFCSRQCQQADLLISLRELPCSRCGATFMQSHWRQVRCTPNCGSQAAGPRECESCGAEFTPKPHLHTQRRCRRDCGKPDPHPCRYCSSLLSNPRQEQCGSTECERAYNAERARAWHRNYTATTGKRYGTDRYREQAAEYHKRRREEQGHWRQLYPEVAALADARRRMLIQQADQGERFAPADVYERDHWTCGLCRLPVDPGLAWPHPMSASVDHILPLSRGGSHTLANVQCAHLGCNSSKGDQVDFALGFRADAETRGC